MKNKVYLAGGFRSNWQKNLIDYLDSNNFEYFNPRNHNLVNPDQYTAWDLHFVRKCDILFGFMEKDNPSGYGLALEIGYAKALGKTVILVDERSAMDQKFNNYFAIINSSSDIVFKSFNEALKYLSKF